MSTGVVALLLLVAALTAVAIATWPIYAAELSFALQAGMVLYLLPVVAVAGVRYQSSRDAHALFVGIGLGVLALQALLFGVGWQISGSVEVVGYLGSVGVASPNAGAVPPLAWQAGWLLAAVCFLLALPWWDRRGRPPIRPGRVIGSALLAVAAIDAALVLWAPAITSRIYGDLVERSLARVGLLGPASWILAGATIALLLVAAFRERGAGRVPRALHCWMAAAFLLAVPLQVAVFLRPTEGLPLVQWADLLQPVVTAVLFVGFLLAQRAEVSTMRRETDRAREITGGRAEIAQMVAHEVRGPVATIRGLASTAERRYDQLSDAERREFLWMIEEESARLLHIADQTSTALKLDAGMLAYHARPEDLGEVVREGVEAAAHRDHPVAIDVEPGIVIPLDRVRFADAVRQLVDNAAKFSPPAAPIDVRCCRDAGTATVEVIDRGPGIAPGDRERVFAKYPGVRPPGYEDVPGTGLGLFICRAEVRQHGGEVIAIAEPGEGTMLRITLPVEGVEG